MALNRLTRWARSPASLVVLALAASACNNSTAPAPTAPVIASFTATPASVPAGSPSSLAWSVSGADSLSIDHGVGTVTGASIPVIPASTTTYRLSATNSVGTTTADVTVTVTLAPPANLTYSTNPAVYVGATPVPNNLPSSTGGAVASYAISPPLPMSLDLDPVTGILTGTPLELWPATDHTVTATNAAGSTTVVLRITVTAPAAPVITVQPANQAVVPPAPATFQVTATGAGPLLYQWKKNADVISGSDANSYTTPATATSDTGTVYRVQVSDLFGNALLSDGATLTVQGFTATGEMSTKRVYHTATLLDDGKVLVTGGTNGVATLATAEIYDPTTGGFTATALPMNTPRQGHSAVRMDGGKVLIAGGNSGAAVLATAEIYDPATRTFTVTGSMPDPRENFAAALVAGNKVLVAGGVGGNVRLPAPLATAALFDPTGNAGVGVFTATASLDTSRENPMAALLQDGKVLVLGGYSGAGYLASAQTFDPLSPAFTSTGGMTFATWKGTATVLASGKVLVAGGQPGFNTVATADLYDPATRSFASTGSMGSARALQTASRLSDGVVLVAGGVLGTAPFATAEFFHPASGTFAPATAQNLVTGRYSHTATVLQDGRVLVAGGNGATGALASAEIWTSIP
jgi:hypothetical protein